MGNLPSDLHGNLNVSSLEGDVRQEYSSIRSNFPLGELVAVMHMTPARTAIALGNSIEVNEILVLELGTAAVSEAHFKHPLPTPYELECAIAAIEDEIARSKTVNGKHFRMLTSDALTHKIARLAGASNDSDFESLSVEAVEQLFRRLVGVAEGQPISYARIPMDRELLAALVILREFMHHLHFSEITFIRNSR